MIHQFVIPEPKGTLGMADFHKIGDHKAIGIFSYGVIIAEDELATMFYFEFFTAKKTITHGSFKFTFIYSDLRTWSITDRLK